MHYPKGDPGLSSPLPYGMVNEAENEQGKWIAAEGRIQDDIDTSALSDRHRQDRLLK